jgi:recombination protein RecA
MAMIPARNLGKEQAPLSPWTLAEVAGRFIELSASGAASLLTTALALVAEAQEQREPVGWVTPVESCFYPPDAAQRGIDLAALVIVRVPAVNGVPRAGEKLLRSGGFGLVVLDLGTGDISMPLQSRLIGLAHRHHAALLCLTEKGSGAPSLGSLVSLRAHAGRRRTTEGFFASQLRVLKDKRRGPTWSYEEFYRGPAGLC